MMEEVATEVLNRARMKGILEPPFAPHLSVGALAGEQSLPWHCNALVLIHPFYDQTQDHTMNLREFSIKSLCLGVRKKA